jgi:sugar phosphate isomerase/epimerase
MTPALGWVVYEKQVAAAGPALRQAVGRRAVAGTTVQGVADLSVQLYSIRDALAADLPGALARLAALGVTRVEPFDVVTDPEGLRDALAAAGLSAPSVHARVGAGDELERVFHAAVTIGVRTVVHPYTPPERWDSEPGVDSVADELARAADAAEAYGLQVGYHNHHWELSNRLGGRSALERLAERLPPAVVLELDTYWAAVGGEDVLALLGRLGERVRLVHLKDGPIDKDNAAQLPLGAGAMPVAAVVEAATAAELAVLEFDDYGGDLFEGLAASVAFANGLGLR